MGLATSRIAKIAIAVVVTVVVLVVVSIALIHLGGGRGIVTNTITTP
jgi:hypothetical protein